MHLVPLRKSEPGKTTSRMAKEQVMANRNWQVELGDGTHVIQLRQNPLTGYAPSRWMGRLLPASGR